MGQLLQIGGKDELFQSRHHSHPARRRLLSALLRSALLATAVIGSALPLGAQGIATALADRGLPADQCARLPLVTEVNEGFGALTVPASLAWVTSGAFHSGQLLLPDVTFPRVSAMSLTTGRVETAFGGLTQSTSGQQLAMESPFYMSPRQDGGFLLLEIGGAQPSRILFVDQNRRVEDWIEVRQRPLQTDMGDTVLMYTALQAVPLGDGALVLGQFGLEEKKEFWHAFAFLSRHDNRYVQVGERYVLGEPHGDSLAEYFKRDLSFMVSFGSSAYVLVLDEVPWVASVEPGSPEMSRLYEFSGQRIPALKRPVDSYQPKIKVLGWMKSVYEAIQDHAMPVGLTRIGQRLMVVQKSAMSWDQTTSWRLSELSRESGGGRIEGSWPLPSTSAHLVVIPSDGGLGLIEKGQISLARGRTPDEGQLYRVTPAALLVPEGWLTHAAQDLLHIDENTCQ